MKQYAEEQDSEILLEGNIKLKDDEPNIENVRESSDSETETENNDEGIINNGLENLGVDVD